MTHELYLLCPNCNRKIYRTIYEPDTDLKCDCGFVYYTTTKNKNISNGLTYNNHRISEQKSMELSIKALHESICK